uniref:Uncharacterized protein n=1 Tax=Marseillevirus LCMAC102 TaxID=2506603 RepID=A0A481YTE0_9VIRU|nr:MAG: hypothetical protein LCMAC102_00650 [Marseillevirus LCMAC102]
MRITFLDECEFTEQVQCSFVNRTKEVQSMIIDTAKSFFRTPHNIPKMIIILYDIKLIFNNCDTAHSHEKYLVIYQKTPCVLDCFVICILYAEWYFADKYFTPFISQDTIALCDALKKYKTLGPFLTKHFDQNTSINR